MKRKLISLALVVVLLLATACSEGTSSKKPDDPINFFVDTIKDSANSPIDSRIDSIFNAGKWIFGMSEAELTKNPYLFDKDSSSNSIYRIDNLTISNKAAYLEVWVNDDRLINHFSLNIISMTSDSKSDLKIVKKYFKGLEGSQLSVNKDKVDNFKTFESRLTDSSPFWVMCTDRIEADGKKFTVLLSKNTNEMPYIYGYEMYDFSL